MPEKRVGRIKGTSKFLHHVALNRWDKLATQRFPHEYRVDPLFTIVRPKDYIQEHLINTRKIQKSSQANRGVARMDGTKWPNIEDWLLLSMDGPSPVCCW